MKSTVSLLALVLITTFSTAASGSSSGGQAAVKLVNASATISQTSDTDWTLKKTGEVDTSAQTVTWTITATEGNTVSGHLVVYGLLTVANSGAKPATIGNIVVNLQSKFGSSWETQSSDIADATHGDNATMAYIDPKASSENQGQFSTNPASGKLDFMDANDNSVFSLEPQKTIAPGASVNLLFSAGFDNNTLKLSDGEAVRAEVIVSFGNSTSNSPSAANVDINGNGQIDPDEAWIRSIPARLGLTVPSQVAANQSVTLTDTASDIATTGTATFSNPTFNLGATSGTVMVNYDGGASGGKLTNCAHLKSADSTVTVGSYKFPNVNGIDLQACDTETITANSSMAAGWNNADLTTYNQTEWGDDSSSTTAADLLTANFKTVYAPVFDSLVIGSTFTLTLDSSKAIFDYLPQTGTPGALSATVNDPTDTASGGFGGDVVALKLNVDFADSALLKANSGLKFGDLTICGLTSDTDLNSKTVRQFFALANTGLGGQATTDSINPDLESIAANLNAAFLDGAPSTWAQEHLFNSACPVWKKGDIVAYDQIGWDGDATASTLLTNHFTSFYGGSSLFIGNTTYFLAFTDAAAILDYLPAAGVAFSLTGSLQNPTDSSSGAFGGDVLALQLDVDFSDGDLLSGNSGLKFGDLTICGLTTTNNGADVSSLNGTTVRQLLSIDNTGLGGGSTSVSVIGLNDLTLDVTGAFDGLDVRTSNSGWGGVPDKWAQQHLRSGACQ